MSETVPSAARSAATSGVSSRADPQERTPAAHRRIRSFYDRYGFPVADLIRKNRIACDLVYLAMKPAEWFFLLVLYLVDANPENRIAVQYLPERK